MLIEMHEKLLKVTLLQRFIEGGIEIGRIFSLKRGAIPIFQLSSTKKENDDNTKR